MAVHKTVITGLIKTVRNLVGEKLSKLPVAKGATPLPAVIRDRVKGLRPAYPFIVVDLDSTQGITPWVKDKYFDEQLDKQVIINEQRIPITVKCYGKDCLDILNELRIMLDYDIARWELNKETGAVFQYCDGVEDVPSFLSTDFVESASLTCYFNAETIWSPSYDDAKDIQRVVADGVVQLEGSNESTAIHLDEPSNL